MILDGHIHIDGYKPDIPAFEAGLAEAGVSGGVVISMSPNCFHKRSAPGDGANARLRLDSLFQRVGGKADLYPLFWIDPMEADALEQVDIACGYGVLGFKVICGHHYPYDDKPMEVFRKIASVGKPILFHSGILWDGKFSSPYNRPAGFEALLDVENLRFSLAHASWPWCDECIAVYGKFLNTKSSGEGTSAEMYIDITPGTPEIYRRELLTKLHTVGYDVENNIIFGSDCLYDNYSGSYSRHWIDIDMEIYRELGLSQDAIDKTFGGNLKRFLGLTGEKKEYRPLTQMR